MNQIKSSFTKILDFTRNLLIVLTTLYLLTFLWKWHWIYAIVGAIPIYIILLNIFGFLTLPLYLLTPENKEFKKSKKLFNKYGFDIEAEAISMIENFNKNEKKEFSPNVFSIENFETAKNCIQDLTESNKRNSVFYCKSYKSLKFTKESIELAFYYLLDSIKFDSNCPIYENKNFADNLRERHMQMLLTFVSESSDEIPEKLIDQISFIGARKIDMGENQLKITELINWRNNEEWKYFLEAFGEDSDLGKVCLKKMN